MCLIALAYHQHPRYPLVLVGNRDEFHARPAEPLFVWGDGSDVIGGRDAQAGGTWLGVTAEGRLGAVTNVREPQSPPPGLRSRGGLIPDFFQQSGQTAAAAAEKLLSEAAHYGPFNLLLYDGSSLCIAGNRPTPHWQPLSPGVHTLSNAALDTPWPKTERLKAALQQWLDAGSTEPSALFAALADETPAPDAELPDTGVGLALERMLATPFIRGAAYGTRASSVVLIGADDFSFEERRFGPNGTALGRCVWRGPQA